jgi:uncharacterized metal-binding protein YceD (DUF177 family)
MLRRDDLLDLNDVLQHPGRELEVDISTELANEADVDLVAPLEGFLHAISTGNLLLISGKFQTKLVLECARCTSPLEIPVEFEVEEQFGVEGTPSSLSAQDYARVAASEEPYPLFEGNSLMVEDLLRQALLLNLPWQSICENGWERPCPKAEAQGIKVEPKLSTRPEFEKLHNLVRKEELSDN